MMAQYVLLVTKNPAYYQKVALTDIKEVSRSFDINCRNSGVSKKMKL